MVTPGQKAFMNSVGLLFSRKPITRPIPPAHDTPLFGLRRWCYNLVMWGPIKNGEMCMKSVFCFLIVCSFIPLAVAVMNIVAKKRKKSSNICAHVCVF